MDYRQLHEAARLQMHALALEIEVFERVGWTAMASAAKTRRAHFVRAATTYEALSAPTQQENEHV